MTEFDLLKALFEAGGLALVSGLSIFLLIRSYREREKLLRQMAAQTEHYHKERLASAQEKALFMQVTHQETLVTVGKLQEFMDKQSTASSTMMQEFVSKGTKALVMNQTALAAVEEALTTNAEILRRNTETWKWLMTWVAA